MMNTVQANPTPVKPSYWTNASADHQTIIDEFVREYDMPIAVACCLAARGITPDSQYVFFNGSLEDLSSPFRFRDMEKAVARLWEAVRGSGTILIYGDYDTDGITATALVSEILKREGARVAPYIPHRFEDGSGFNIEALERALAILPEGETCSLLITVDCGIYGNETIEYARQHGIDAIITDHHEPHAVLPDAFAILNPKTFSEDTADIMNLCGVGVAFKLAHAFLQYGHRLGFTSHDESDIRRVLDYVALGTIADIVPVTGENRLLVRYGLEVIRKHPRPGIAALIESAGIRAESVSTTDITYKLAPRINAAGRLHDAVLAFRLLTTEALPDTQPLVTEIEAINHERHTREHEIYTLALTQLHDDPDFSKKSTIIAGGADWHRGVIGIVASKIAAAFKRPTIIISLCDGIAHGSVRSINQVNLMNVFAQFSDLIPEPRYGGHSMAVGFDLPEDKLDELKVRFEEAVRKELANSTQMADAIVYDGEITLGDLNADFFEYYPHLEPFGQNNCPPKFLVRDLHVDFFYPKKGASLRGVLKDGNGFTYDFISSDCVPPHDETIDVIVSPQPPALAGHIRNRLNLITFRTH